MKTIRRTKIRFEKHELTRISLSRRTSFFCRDCEIETIHLTVAQTSIALDISELNIFRMAETGQIHSTETVHGRLMICTKVSGK